MAGSMNRATLVGRIGKAPEARNTQGGSIVSFSLATSERWKDRSTNEWKEKTEWHTIVVFNENLGKLLEEHGRKGSNVLIEGKIQTRKWQDQSGTDRYSTEIVVDTFAGKVLLLDSAQTRGEGTQSRQDRPAQPRPGSPRESAGGRQRPQAAPARAPAGDFEPLNDFDDEIPF